MLALTGKMIMDTLEPQAGLLVRSIDGEAVILDRGAGQIHTLNATASFIWNKLTGGSAIPEIVKGFAETFDVDDQVAQADVEHMLESFRELKLIRPRGEK